MTTAPDPSALIIPFGKHKGATVAELLVKDPAYMDWLVAQGDFGERRPDLHAAMVARGAGHDDSPAHNAMQVRFLDRDFRFACLMCSHEDLVEETGKVIEKKLSRRREQKRDVARRNAEAAQRILARTEQWRDRYDPQDAKEIANRAQMHPSMWVPPNEAVAKAQSSVTKCLATFAACEADAAKNPHVACLTRPRFEQYGVDVVIQWIVMPDDDECDDEVKDVRIELKPTMGDDYPSVLRQMLRERADTLVLGSYHGTAVTEEQMLRMFEANDHKVIFVREIEARMKRSNGDSLP